MYNYLIGKKKEEIPSKIDGMPVCIELAKDNQLKNYNAELIVRVKIIDNKICLTTQYFKLK